jgi:hypothetical protein
VSLLTDEVRAYIGRTTAPVIERIEASRIHAFARALCYPEPPNARWLGQEAEAPFDFIATFVDYSGAEPASISPPLPPTHNVLKASADFALFRPIRAGDTLRVYHRLADLSERPAGNIPRVFSILETIGEDEAGEPVFCIRTTLVRIYPPEEARG